MLSMTRPSFHRNSVIFSIAAVGICYLYIDPWRTRRRMIERMWFLLSKRNLKEADLERALVQAPEPPIIADNTQFVELNGHRLRIVHIIHELGSRVPLIVFIHGLGGQVSQWQRQIEYFSQTAHVLAIDLLGCGSSEVASDWDSYATDSLVKDVTDLLLNRYNYPSTVIIAHSYGCSIATFVAASPEIQTSLKALVLISPKENVDEAQKRSQRMIRWIPDWLFEWARTKDRKKGIYSQSVERLLGNESNIELRRQQLRWNLLSRTSVYKRLLFGARFPGKKVYENINAGVLLIGGNEDKITSPKDMFAIRDHLLGLDPLNNSSERLASLEEIRVPEPYVIPDVGHTPMVVRPQLVNAVISEFLIKNCGLDTLSGAWQVLHKTKGENKWDLKNYEKWARTANITTEPIGISLFRAMKVMRQTDTNHCPSAFLARYPEIGFIIDISNDTPPYRSSDFDHSRIKYLKLKTVSKIPPTREDVAKFIELTSSCWEERPDAQVAVHCHYGFNRTGFFICCYMIEKLGVSVPDAIEAFAAARPPGIRHAHFVDELYLRYSLLHRT